MHCLLDQAVVESDRSRDCCSLWGVNISAASTRAAGVTQSAAIELWRLLWVASTPDGLDEDEPELMVLDRRRTDIVVAKLDEWKRLRRIDCVEARKRIRCNGVME